MFYRILPVVFLSLSLQAKDSKHFAFVDPGVWLTQEAQIAAYKMQQNIHPPGTAPGIVVASPQTQNPDYFRHWIRDAAITMDVAITLIARSGRNSMRGADEMVASYVAMSRQNQLVQSVFGLGEPLFEVNGDLYRGGWGRPQNDGPALRAIALLKYAQLLKDRGDQKYILTWLYNPSAEPKATVIKYDLDYIANHWRDPSIDLWEEVRGDHFFTRMVQRRALYMGAIFAQKMGDQTAADFYKNQADNITQALAAHWDGNRNILVTTVNYSGGVDYKNSGLDIGVILGALYGEWGNAFSVNDPRVSRTFERLVQAFSTIYPVNSAPGVPGVALGRYPEDRYAGTDFNGGNPWVLATLAGAELYYRLAGLAAQNPNTLNIARKLLASGDEFVQRVQFHANPDGSLSEQINRFNGYMTSARDLTWNYAAVERTFWARQLATSRMPRVR